LLDTVDITRLTINVAAKHVVPILYIVHRISDILKIRPHCIEVQSGEAYPISIEFIEGLLHSDGPIFGEEY